MTLLVTRPLEDARALASQLSRLGHETLVAPLLEIVFRDEAELPARDFQAILITSANGARALARRPDVEALKDLRVFTVGPASATAMQAAGFRRVESADGNADALAAAVTIGLSPLDGPLLHVAGSVVAGDLAAVLAMQGFDVTRVALYEAVTPVQLPETIARALRDGSLDGALFFSPRTASQFLRLVEAAGLASTLSRVTGFALSEAVARVLAPAGFRQRHIAEEPTQTAMLHLIATLMSAPDKASAPDGAKFT